MADSKISALPAVVTPAGTDEFAVNQGGTSKKITATQILDGTVPYAGNITQSQVSDIATVTQGDAEAGIATVDKLWTAERVKQAIVAQSGAGNVTKVGTPVDNQLAVWTGDGTLEGDTGYGVIAGVFAATSSSGPALLNENPSAINPNLVPSKTDLDSGIGQNAADQVSIIAGGLEGLRVSEAAGSVQNLSVDGTDLLPGYAFISDPDLGFFRFSPNIMGFASGGTAAWAFSSSVMGTLLSGARPTMQNELATSTNPNINPNAGDSDSGLGSNGDDTLVLIAGALDCINIAETGGAREIGFYVTAPIALQTGVAVTAGGVHAALVALGLITA